MDILEIAECHTLRAHQIIERTGIMNIWRGVGAEPHLIGSVRMGLVARNLDIDIHVYSDPLTVAASWEAMSRFAVQPGVRTVTYGNSIDTPEECMEWHAEYRAPEGDEWKIDMIHIRRGSMYDGHMERLADRVAEVLTPETRRAILELKFASPEGTGMMGIEYYRAVLEGGVRSWEEFGAWHAANASNGVIDWIP